MLMSLSEERCLWSPCCDRPLEQLLLCVAMTSSNKASFASMAAGHHLRVLVSTFLLSLFFFFLWYWYWVQAQGLEPLELCHQPFCIVFCF
jgi:hypothetical protein